MAEPEQPLQGRRILLPSRPDGSWAEALERAGAYVDEVDLVMREPLQDADFAGWARLLGDGGVAWMVFTSAFAVTAAEATGHPWREAVPTSVRIASVGPGTAAVVERELGRAVDLVPAKGTGSEALVREFPGGEGLVVIPGPETTADELSSDLASRGWTVERWPLYVTTAVQSVPRRIIRRWRTGEYDALIGTSGSVIRAAAGVLGTNLAVISLGARGTHVAHEVGFTTVVEAAAATPGGVLAALGRLPASKV